MSVNVHGKVACSMPSETDCRDGLCVSYSIAALLFDDHYGICFLFECKKVLSVFYVANAEK